MYGWNYKAYKSKGRDLSNEFETLCLESKERDFKSLKEKNYTFLLIPGLFTNNYGANYMKDNIKHLQSLDLDVRKAEIDTNQTILFNAKIICDIILSIAEEQKRERNIVIIGHSKGGIDAGTAIAKYDLYQHIKCMVMLQTPWSGTILAEELEYKGIFSSLYRIASSICDISLETIVELKYEERRKLIKQYPLDVNRVRVICLYSICNESSFLYPIYSFLKRKHGIESDGIVGKDDALLTDADYIQVKNLDHSSAVFSFSALNPGQITYALAVLSTI